MSYSIKVFSLFISLFFVASIFLPSNTKAATLDSVGNIDVEGSSFAQLWFSGSTPTLAGETTPGTSVSVSVDGQTAAAIVDADGNWSYPLNLTEGDHQISLSSGGVVFSTFTLTIGEEVPEGTIGNPTDDPNATEELPATGAFELTLITAISGLFLIAGSRFLPKRSI